MANGSVGTRPGRPRIGRRRRRLRWTLALLTGAGLIGAGTLWALHRSGRERGYVPGENLAEITRTLSHDLPADAPRPRFLDVTAEAGLSDFRAFSGSRTSQLPEDMGPGAAWGDFDNDGDDDLLLVAAGGPLTAAPETWAPTVLYENLGDGTFRRSQALPDLRLIGMGAAWGDYDADGDEDLVLTGYGALRLLRNDGGRLTPGAALPAPDGFWAGPSWGDYDGDRDLDLYVCGYVRYDDSNRGGVSQQYGRAVPYTLNPASYAPERNLLFRNDGGDRFVEVAVAAGVDNPEGRSLGALWHDFDDDGHLDLYVANDISDNALYRNAGNGRFEDRSHAAWVADYRGAMGLAAGDWNRDGDDDLFVTHWIAQENALYDSLLHNASGDNEAAPALRFVDVADQRGLGQIALRRVGWGTEFADLDADGWLDLVVVNGSTFERDDDPDRLQAEAPFLFWNRRGQHFHDLAPLSEPLSRPIVGRGLSLADYDDDGDLDLLLVDRDAGARLLRNEMVQGNWIKLRLRGGLGATGSPAGRGRGVRITAAVGDTLLRRAVGGPSYLSQSSHEVHIGLGDAERVDRLELRWPAGETVAAENLESGATWEWVEGDTHPRRSQTTPEGGGRAPVAPQAARRPSERELDREQIAAFWRAQRAAMDALKRDGDCPRAVEFFRQALALKPGHEDSLYYLAGCLAALGDQPAAIEQLERLVHDNPASQRGYRQLGLLQVETSRGTRDLERASESLERAVAINPEETGALLALGELSLIRGRTELAERHLAHACHTNPRAVGGFFLLGYLAWARGDRDTAVARLQEAHAARGPEWKPEGTTAEGDVQKMMHTDRTPLSSTWTRWDGNPDPDNTYPSLQRLLRKFAE